MFSEAIKSFFQIALPFSHHDFFNHQAFLHWLEISDVSPRDVRVPAPLPRRLRLGEPPS